MNKTLRIVLIWMLLLSPVWLGLLVVMIQPNRQGDPVMMLGQVAGVTVIGCIGLAVSAFTRKRNSADVLSVVGYAVPALLVGSYQLFTV